MRATSTRGTSGGNWEEVDREDKDDTVEVEVDEEEIYHDYDFNKDDRSGGGARGGAGRGKRSRKQRRGRQCNLTAKSRARQNGINSTERITLPLEPHITTFHASFR